MIGVVMLLVFVPSYAALVDRFTRGTPPLIRFISLGHIFMLAAYLGATHPW